MRSALSLRRVYAVFGPLVLLWGMMSCAGERSLDSERADWLRTTLFEDHQDLWLRDRNLVAHKFALMASDPYRFLRGTLPQYLRDVMEDGSNATAFASSDSSQILLMGDPHLENFGTFLSSSGNVVVELNDFDSAQYGPFHFDLRRFVSSVYVAHRYWTSTLAEQSADETDDEEEARFVRLAVTSYLDEVERLHASGGNEINDALETSNAWLDDFRSRSLQRGIDAHPLQKWTRLEDGKRVLGTEMDVSVNETVGPDDLLRPLSADEEKEIRDALQTYPVSMLAPRLGLPSQVKAMARRYGAGISSIPLRRIYLLMEGESSGHEDDFILELKEARDPFVFSDLPLAPRRAFRQNAERIVESQRRLQCEPDLDPWLGYTDGAGAYRVRELSGYQDGIDIESIREAWQEGSIRTSELEDLVDGLSRILARSHARGSTMSGDSSLLAIANVVKKNPAAMIAETTDFGVRYGQQILADYELFVRLIYEYGTDLGFPRLYP